MEGEDGRPSSGTHVDCLMCQIDGSALSTCHRQRIGRALTSAIEPEFSQFGIVGDRYDLDILQNGVPDEELAERLYFYRSGSGIPDYLGDGFTRLVKFLPRLLCRSLTVEVFGEMNFSRLFSTWKRPLCTITSLPLAGLFRELQDNLTC